MANGQELVRIKSNGKLHFPKNIPRERTGVAYKWMYMTWAVLLPAALGLSPSKSIAVKMTTIAAQLAGTLALLTGVEIFRRICYALEERNYLYSRYNNNYNTLFYRIFSLSPRCTKIVGLSVFTLAVIPFKFDDMFATKDDLLSYIPTLVSVLLVSPTLQLDHCPHNDSLKITQKRSSDYGSSMAHSFFHGYLKIVLPADGHSPLNIKDLMERYESRHNIKFQTHKLYILVPLSLECPNEIGLSGNMEPCKTLDSIKKDVAGVKDRTYHNSVYKIKTDKVRDPIYACVEYATPLRTLYYSLKSNTDHADFYREHIKDIIWNFYVNTTELIESDMDTKGLCELLYYDDKNVGDIGEMLAIKIIKERYRLHQNQP